MILDLKVLFLLWMINFAPPLTAFFLEEKWAHPLDFGKRMQDGNPVFGAHKTIRGIAVGIATGILVGFVCGFPLWIGCACGVLSMLGDLCSSFVKRRRGYHSGKDIPGLDQGVEGLFPLLLLKHQLPLSWNTTLVLLVLFSIGAYIGSLLYKKSIHKVTSKYSCYPRPLKPRLMAKEYASCHIQSKFLSSFLHFEDAIYYHLFIQSLFKCLGLYDRGVANALCFRQKNLSLAIANLPREFEGYRILFMSDLHLDGLPGLSERLITLLPEIPVDLCLLGGDYRMATHGSYKDSLTRLDLVTKSIRAKDGILAVLGNHDCIEMTEALVSMGVRILVNESTCIRKGQNRLWIVGADEPHYFKCADIHQAFQDVPAKECTIFLAHSPEVYNEVKQMADLYLAGHTHGGQIQIPPFGPVFTHCSAPRRMCQGTWNAGPMQGYTTNGVGVSGVPIRFNCPGEIVVITLAGTTDRPS